MRRISFIVVWFVSLILCLPAHAELNFCNGSPLTIETAVGEFVGGKWQARGWWTLNPGESATVVGGTLPNRYFYAYAQTVGSKRQWTGNFSFCTSSNVFTTDRDGCGVGDQKKFSQIDTNNAKSLNYWFECPECLDQRMVSAAQRNIPFLESLLNYAPLSVRQDQWQDVGPCDIIYGVSRSPFHISINGNRISISARFSYWLSVSNDLPIIGRQGLASCGCDGEPDQNIDVTMTTIFGITPAGKLFSKTRTTNLSFPTPCQVTILNIDVTGLVEERAHLILDKGADYLDSRVGEIDLSQVINARELYY